MQRLLGKVQKVPNITIDYFSTQDCLFQIIFPYFAYPHLSAIHNKASLSLSVRHQDYLVV